MSEKGITMIALPRQSKRAVQQELDSAASPLTPAGSAERFGPERLTAEGLAEVLSRGGRGDVKMLERAAKQLGAYFSGERVSFDLPLDLRYYTRFQQAVWKAASEVPFGETRSYAWIAKRIKKPRASRAVGQALGANPVPIIIP
jgi:O6-methylguanine-DNA--protein-cysteine methyltransferase